MFLANLSLLREENGSELFQSKGMGDCFSVSVFVGPDIPQIESALEAVASLVGSDLSSHVLPDSSSLNIWGYVGEDNGFTIDGFYSVVASGSPLVIGKDTITQLTPGRGSVGQIASGDSSCESSVIAGGHELAAPNLQEPELAELQQGA
jgi:hypothetical protein